MIEVTHNENRLPCRRGYRIRSSRGVEKAIQKLTGERRARGLRVRYAVDHPTNYLHLETRNAMAMDTVVVHLRAQRFLVERLAPKDY